MTEIVWRKFFGNNSICSHFVRGINLTRLFFQAIMIKVIGKILLVFLSFEHVPAHGVSLWIIEAL